MKTLKRCPGRQRPETALNPTLESDLDALFPSARERVVTVFENLVSGSNSKRVSAGVVRLMPRLIGQWEDESNCWGTTLWTLGVLPSATFIDGDEMQDWLRSNTRAIRKPRFGDVVVFRYKDSSQVVRYGDNGPDSENGYIRHTALCVGDDLWWHQAGFGGDFRLESLKAVKEIYSGGVVEFRRPKAVA